MRVPGLLMVLFGTVLFGQALAPPLPVPGRGEVRLALTAGWREVRRETPAGRPPSVAFERTSTPRGSLELTVFWDPKRGPGFTSAENLRRITLKGQAAVRENAVEKDLPLVPIRGAAGQGFFYAATDRTFMKPIGNPVPGDYPVLTHGELGLGPLVLSFTIFSDGKDDAAVREALEALQGATLGKR